MNYRINTIVFIIFVVCSCKEVGETKPFSQPVKSISYHSDEHLIEAEELDVVLQESTIKVIDFRKPSEYKKGHIPYALNLWRPDIEHKNYPYNGIIAEQKNVEQVLSKLGVHQNDIIIIYDDRGLCDASRLWWVLKTYNFKSIKLLNGGWTAWKNNKGMISMETPKIKASEFEFVGNPTNDLFMDKNELRSLLDKDGIVLIDTRTVDEYSGRRQKSGATRSGRIPMSINIDWMQSIEKKTTQKFKSRKELEIIYAVAGKSKNIPIITYCHTGVRSAHTTFVLTELLGYTNVKNYDGSWSEWSYFDDLPIEKDSIAKVLN